MADGTRSEITVAHIEDCKCMDVRLSAICEHVDRVVKRGHVAKRFRDDLVIIIKIRRRLPQPAPKEVRTSALGTKQAIQRPGGEVEKDDKMIQVVDSRRNQKLVEKWKKLNAWKERCIWKDW
jgi:hypothetical protein